MLIYLTCERSERYILNVLNTYTHANSFPTVQKVLSLNHPRRSIHPLQTVYYLLPNFCVLHQLTFTHFHLHPASSSVQSKLQHRRINPPKPPSIHCTNRTEIVYQHSSRKHFNKHKLSYYFLYTHPLTHTHTHTECTPYCFHISASQSKRTPYATCHHARSPGLWLE